MNKFFFVLSFFAFSAVVSAASVTVLETSIPHTRGHTTVDTRFYMDTDMKEGFAKIVVQEEEFINNYPGNCGPWGPRYPGPHYCNRTPTRTYRTIFSDQVKIEGLTMNGNEVIYQGASGDITCGTMGTSRVFKVPTLYLSGKCSLQGNVFIENGMKKLTVRFHTK